MEKTVLVLLFALIIWSAFKMRGNPKTVVQKTAAQQTIESILTPPAPPRSAGNPVNVISMGCGCNSW